MSKPFTVAEIREAFLAFFAEKNCVRYASASLVPENDPTTLFTVAGMSQFKDMFLGRGTHPFTRATVGRVEAASKPCRHERARIELCSERVGHACVAEVLDRDEKGFLVREVEAR